MMDSELNVIINRLLSDARRVMERAYSPYSKFAVGAALHSTGGGVFVGCNVENISFGLTMCAERVCIGTGVAAGESAFDLIAIFSDSAEPVMPCGACRQVLAEFGPDMLVVSSTSSGLVAQQRLSTLLPKPRQGILG